MAKPTTRQEYIDYCLRKLGKPVININVATDQLDDRVDEALDMFVDHHYDATVEDWLSYPITQTDIDNGYIELPDDIINVIDIIDVSELFAHTNMFSYQYQIAINELSPWQPFDQLDYFMKVTNYDSITSLTNVSPRFDYIRHGRQLKVYYDFAVGYPLGLKVQRILDPNTMTKIWNDPWLKKYGTALFKKQWAENVSKFENIQLLGGVTINGEQLMQRALDEIERLEEELEETYSYPTDFIFG